MTIYIVQCTSKNAESSYIDLTDAFIEAFKNKNDAKNVLIP